jgi:lipoprotein-releasing system permease protein
VNVELKLAWKYFRVRRKSLARFTAAVAVVGISCGVASLIVAQALSRGFSNEMQEKILNNTAHLTVFQTNGEGIYNWQLIRENAEKLENVRGVAPTTYESVLIAGEKATSYGVLRAMENGKWKAVNEAVVRTSQSGIEIAVGAELAEKTGLKIGDEAEIVLPASPNEFVPKTSRVRVKDVFRTGLYDYDATWIYISFEDLARAFGKSNFAPTVLSVAVDDIYAADKTARKIRGILPPGFKVVDWQEANQPLFAALSLEKKFSLAIISLIIFIAALNITTTLALLVNERKLDIAVLRTCGAQTRSLISIFLFEGLLLGLTGIFSGTVLGLLMCFAGNYFKIISLPSDVYSLSYIPLASSLGDILLIVAIAFLLTLTATIYPAWRAAKIKPLENLRNA